MSVRRGLDAHLVDSNAPGGKAIRFDPKHDRLLISSFSHEGFRGDDRGSTLWDFVSGSRHVTKIKSNGPVAFSPNGTALQLTYEPPRTLRLWDVDREFVVREFVIPVAAASGPSRPNIRYRSSITRRSPRTALGWRRRPRITLIGPGYSSGMLFRASSFTIWPDVPSSLRLSSDGNLLAGGDDSGKIHIWSLADGLEVCSPSHERLTVSSLAFGRNLRARLTRNETRNTQNVAGGWRPGIGAET